MEISSKAGHILGLGLESSSPGLSFESTLEAIHDQGGLAVIPHPFQESRHGVMARISANSFALGDAIEVYNSVCLPVGRTGRPNATPGLEICR